MKSDTVFGHLVHQFAVHPEDLATEALCFILRTSPAASRAFSAFVSQVGFNFPEGLHFETQRPELDQSRPDMTCFDDKRQLRVIVENKFWAGLTENQPVTYIRGLPDGVATLVLFVVPETRLQFVWREVVRRCNDAKIPVGENQNRTAIMFAEIGNGHYIAATSWGVLLDYLSASIPLAGEIDCRGDIVQLQGLCRTMDEETFLPLRGDEVTNLDMAQRYINFSDLAFAILIEAVDKGFCSREGIRERNYRYGPGAFFRIGNYKPWIGFGARSWLRLGASPIWIIFLPLPENPTSVISERLVGFRTCIPQRCYDGYGRNDGRLLIPVLLRTGVDKKDIIKDAVDQIGELMAKLGVQISLITPPIPNQTDEIDEDPEYNPESETNE